VIRKETHDGYDFYTGYLNSERIGEQCFNIVPQGSPAPTGGYVSREWVEKVKGVKFYFYAMQSRTCVWFQEGDKYLPSCGKHSIAFCFGDYCPFCGKHVAMSDPRGMILIEVKA